MPRRSRSSSRSKKSKKKSRTRSSSREASKDSKRRYESKSSRRDRSRDRYKSRDSSRGRHRSKERSKDYGSHSRDYYSSRTSKKSSRDHSRDRDRDRDRYKSKSKKRRHRSSSSSHSTSSRSTTASKSSSRRYAASRRSRSKSIHTSPAKSFVVERFNFTDAVNVLDAARETIEDIERDEFVPQEFTSSAAIKRQQEKDAAEAARKLKEATTKKLPEKVKIDLVNEQVIVPVVKEEKPAEDPLINPAYFGDLDDTERMRKWVRKLMYYRQKAREAREAS